MPSLPDEKELVIVSITNHDVAGYNRRSHQRVTAVELAEWWMNRLTDRVNLFARGEAPRLTVAHEDGQILAELYERAGKEAGGPQKSDAVYQTLKSLSSEQRNLLSYEGVRVIPHHEHNGAS